MTTLREAAQQALEALDAYSWEQVNAARAALRTALSEQCPCGEKPKAECPGEWEPGCDLGANAKYARRVKREREPSLQQLRRMMCGVGVVGQIDGHDVIRRDSVIELIDRAIRATGCEA
jgi:hypothetical protein